jgi:hypothetical protein
MVNDVYLVNQLRELLRGETQASDWLKLQNIPTIVN